MPSPEARARACVGVRFRLHGRSPLSGLDCLGLVAHAYRLSEVPTGYGLRTEGQRLEAGLRRFGFHTVWGPPCAGDVLLFRCGPQAHHLAIRTGTGTIHADMRHRRVVETTGLPPWPLLSVWHRFSGES